MRTAIYVSPPPELSSLFCLLLAGHNQVARGLHPEDLLELEPGGIEKSAVLRLSPFPAAGLAHHYHGQILVEGPLRRRVIRLEHRLADQQDAAGRQCVVAIAQDLQAALIAPVMHDMAED